MPSPAVALDRVSKRYRRHGPLVLDDISQGFDPGRHLVVLGSNGSGKSTLLALIAGAARPTQGRVHPATSVAYVPERLPGTIRFTASQYLGHMGRIRGLPNNAVRRRAEELCARLNLAADAPYVDLSKGNRQKVMLAQAFLGPVSAIALDEPASGLDDASLSALDRLLSEARAQGAALISTAQTVPGWSEVDRVLRVAEGQLQPVTEARRGAASDRVLIEATDPPDHRGPPPQGLPGSAQIRSTENGVVVVTDAPEVNGAILALIRQGWSIRRVTPSHSVRRGHDLS
jgi:ABC-type multidrug transport system ATPase subunit